MAAIFYPLSWQHHLQRGLALKGKADWETAHIVTLKSHHTLYIDYIDAEKNKIWTPLNTEAVRCFVKDPSYRGTFESGDTYLKVAKIAEQLAISYYELFNEVNRLRKEVGKSFRGDFHKDRRVLVVELLSDDAYRNPERKYNMQEIYRASGLWKSVVDVYISHIVKECFKEDKNKTVDDMTPDLCKKMLYCFMHKKEDSETVVKMNAEILKKWLEQKKNKVPHSESFPFLQKLSNQVGKSCRYFAEFKRLKCSETLGVRFFKIISDSICRGPDEKCNISQIYNVSGMWKGAVDVYIKHILKECFGEDVSKTIEDLTPEVLSLVTYEGKWNKKVSEEILIKWNEEKTVDGTSLPDLEEISMLLGKTKHACLRFLNCQKLKQKITSDVSDTSFQESLVKVDSPISEELTQLPLLNEVRSLLGPLGSDAIPLFD